MNGRLVAAAAVAMLLASPLKAETPPMEQHTILDREGFGTEIEAMAVQLPANWKVRSRIAWNKPCSGNDLYDLLLRAQSPDARYGFQFMPTRGSSYFEFLVMPGSLDPQLQAMFEADQARRRQEMVTRFAGTNCHFGPPLAALDIVRRFVLPTRPAGAEIVSVTPLQHVQKSLLDMMRKTISDLPGAETTLSADAATIRLRYVIGGTTFEEDVSVAGTGIVTRSRSSMGTIDTITHGFTLPIESYWAPAGQLDALKPTIAAIKTSIRGNPRWLAAVEETRRAIAEIRRKGAVRRHEIWQDTMKEISDRQSESWKTSQESQDKMHDKFIDTIWERPDDEDDEDERKKKEKERKP